MNISIYVLLLVRTLKNIVLGLGAARVGPSKQLLPHQLDCSVTISGPIRSGFQVEPASVARERDTGWFEGKGNLWLVVGLLEAKRGFRTFS
jgi:hypothetical protein